MAEMICVTIGGKRKEYPKGTTYLEISKEVQKDYPQDIILACVNNKLHELNKEVHEDCDVEFVTVQDPAGYRTYSRGVTFVMLKAAYSVIGRENLEKIAIKFRIGTGNYCVLGGDVDVTEELLRKIENRMREIVEEDTKR